MKCFIAMLVVIGIYLIVKNKRKVIMPEITASVTSLITPITTNAISSITIPVKTQSILPSVSVIVKQPFTAPLIVTIDDKTSVLKNINDTIAYGKQQNTIGMQQVDQAEKQFFGYGQIPEWVTNWVKPNFGAAQITGNGFNGVP